MKPLGEVIEALRRELQAAAGGRSTARIQCAVVDRAGEPLRFAVPAVGDELSAPNCAITLEVELNPGSGVALAGASPVETPVPKDERSEREQTLIGQLTAMFGPPGFDNAARASVFREIVEELQPDQLTALLDSLSREMAEVPLVKPADAAVAMARTRLVRLLKLGPAGFPGGVETMLQAFRENAPGDVVETIRRTWKTQSEWIDTTPPGVKLQ